MERKKIGQIQGRISRRRLVRNPTINTSLSTCIPNITTLACTVSQKSLTKNFIIQSIERKKIGQIQGRISRRRLVRNPSIQYIIINLHTKYDYSRLHSFTEICDENSIIQSIERKKIGQTQGRISRRRLVRNPTIQYIIINLHTKYDYRTLACTVAQKSLTKNFIIQSMERKKIGQIQGRISRRRLVRNPTINTSLSTCIPNITTLACTVSQKSLTKNFIIQSMERKKIGQIQGRISRRRLVCNPTIQHVIINLYTKYESSSLQGCGEIFEEKVLRNYGRTDGRKE